MIERFILPFGRNVSFPNPNPNPEPPRRLAALVVTASLLSGFHSSSLAEIRLWKRGAPGGFNAVLYVQNTGTQAQQCAVSWADANRAFGNGHTVIVKPGATESIQTGVVAVNEEARCHPWVDPQEQRAQEERRRREADAQSADALRRSQQEEQRARQQLFGAPAEAAKAGSTGVGQQSGASVTPHAAAAPQATARAAPALVRPPQAAAPSSPIYQPPPDPSVTRASRATQLIGAVGAGLDAMSRASEREEQEKLYRQDRAAQIENDARQAVGNGADVNPWGVEK